MPKGTPYATNEDRIAGRKAACARYRAKKGGTDLAYQQQWRKNNKEKCQAYSRKGYLAHKKEHATRNRLWFKNNPERAKQLRRRAALWRKYRITPDHWDALFEAQGCRCAVCKTINPGATNWHTDHNPHLKKGHPEFIRGILCHHCNVTLRYDTTPTWLRALAIYLEEHSV